jgi:chitodextrinase
MAANEESTAPALAVQEIAYPTENYAITPGDGVVVDSATADTSDLKVVHLTVSGLLPETEYTLKVNNVTDSHGPSSRPPPRSTSSPRVCSKATVASAPHAAASPRARPASRRRPARRPIR